MLGAMAQRRVILKSPKKPIRVPVKGVTHDVVPIERKPIRKKRKPVRRPIQIIEPKQLPPPKNTLGQLIANDHFEITEEDLTEAASESSREETVDSTWEDLTKQMVKASCAFFAQEVLTGPAQPPYNGKFYISEHHEEWDDLVCKYDRICVLAPRDHSKTQFFNFAYPLWKACTMPWGKGFILSATAPQAERILEDIIAEVEGNPKLHWLIPSRKESRKWSSKYVRFSNGHRIYARGFGTKVRGFHPDYIICDDVLNDETAYSALVRRKQIDYYYNAISNMIVPGGQMICVGTPFHLEDLYGDLKENEEYEFRKYEATPEKPLWPERYDSKALRRKEREIGTIRFTREFRCEPVSEGMSLFPKRLFRGDPVEQFNIKLGMPAEFWEKAGITRYTGVDIAMSSSVSADYTVVLTVGLDNFGNRWLVDIQRAKGMAYKDQLSMINAVGRKYEPMLIFIEDNQMQRIFGDELIRLSDLPICKFTTTAEKHALDKGIPSLRILLENGKFRIPRGDKRSVELTDLLIEEMHSFTFQDGKVISVGGHDDMALALWIADQAVKRGGFQFSFGDEEYAGTLDDYLDELTGDTKVNEARKDQKLVHGISEDLSELAGVDLSKLEGEDLLRAIVRKQMGGRRNKSVPAVATTPLSNLGPNELVDEREVW